MVQGRLYRSTNAKLDAENWYRMLIDCKHYDDGKCTGGYWFNPTPTACLTMCENKIPVGTKGLGDTISNVINKVSRGKVTPCGGCKKRQNKLNEIFPYKDKNNGN